VSLKFIISGLVLFLLAACTSYDMAYMRPYSRNSSYNGSYYSPRYSVDRNYCRTHPHKCNPSLGGGQPAQYFPDAATPAFVASYGVPYIETTVRPAQSYMPPAGGAMPALMAPNLDSGNTTSAPPPREDWGTSPAGLVTTSGLPGPDYGGVPASTNNAGDSRPVNPDEPTFRSGVVTPPPEPAATAPLFGCLGAIGGKCR
jgi:hypothetical protein